MRRVYYGHDVAAASKELGRVVVENCRNLTKRVKESAARQREESAKRPAALAIGDVPFFTFRYGQGGKLFVAAVYERSRWFLESDPDGISLTQYDSGEADHQGEWKEAKLSDLPPEARRVAKEIRAILRYEETTADKRRAKRRQKSRDVWEAEMLAKHPDWKGADGRLDFEKVKAISKRYEEKEALFEAESGASR